MAFRHFKDPQTLVIGVLGDGPFCDDLAQLAAVRSVEGRPAAVLT